MLLAMMTLRNLCNVFLVAAISAAITACGSSAPKRPNHSQATPTKDYSQTKNAQLPAKAAGIHGFYRQWHGTPYRLGGMSKSGVDCSGFATLLYQNVFQQTIPRTTAQQISNGDVINRSQLQYGDLVFFKTSKKVRHVGVYVGNQEFVHASTSKGVMKSRLDNPYWKKTYIASRRYL